MPSKPNPSAAATPSDDRNDATTRASKENTPGPRLPNERDESVDSQSAPDPSHVDVRNEAFKDAATGRPDTDKGPVLDEVYNDQHGRDSGPPRR